MAAKFFAKTCESLQGVERQTVNDVTLCECVFEVGPEGSDYTINHYCFLLKRKCKYLFILAESR